MPQWVKSQKKRHLLYHLCRKGFLGAESFPITPFGVGNSLEFASTSTQAVPTFSLITVQ
jgi:hypothetical protein